MFKGSFAKIFMMGVSPVTLDDVTSGFNIGWHISTKPEFDKRYEVVKGKVVPRE
jgi:hypothetical protein